MQIFFRKIQLLSLSALLCMGVLMDTYADNELLIKADSLFTVRKYTEAAAIYEKAISGNDPVTPAVYLKMAFIKESAGSYDQALYYLNCYYHHAPSQPVLRKMETLAAQYHLQGYAFTEADLLSGLYERYFFYLASGIALFSLLLFISLLVRRRQKHFVPVRRNLAFVLLLAAFLIFLNLHPQPHYLILRQDATFLKAAPAAGSAVVAVLDKGHRLPLKNKSDVWLETEWNHRKAFLHQKNARLVK